MQLSFIKP